MTGVLNLSKVLVVSFSVDNKKGIFLSILHYTSYKNHLFAMEGHQQNWKCLLYFFDMKSCSLGVQGCQGMFFKTVSFSEDFFLHSLEVSKFTVIDVIMQANSHILAVFMVLKCVQNLWANIRIYPEVPKLTYLEVHKLTARTKNSKLQALCH